MVAAGYARRRATGSRVRDGERENEMSLSYCDIPAVNATEDDPKACTGHLGKFDDCLAQALHGLFMEGTFDDETGDTDFEGHVVLLLVTEAQPARVDYHDEREVLVAPGNYLLWTASSGRVTLSTTDTPDEARRIVESVSERYSMLERGCDVDDAAAHADCAEYDECQVRRGRA